MKCPNCKIELLGSMKKCPKCGYDTEKGSVDQAYLSSLSKSREKTPEPPQHKIMSCEGKFSENDEKWKVHEIVLVDDAVLKVFPSKKRSFGRNLTRGAFGMIGTMIYDAAHEDEYNTPVFEVPLTEITAIERSNNPQFSMGWGVRLKDGRVINFMFDQPMIKALKNLVAHNE